MRILDRHIASHVFLGTLLTLLVLVALFAFIAFVDDLDAVGKGSYTLAKAIEHMLLTMPRQAFLLFPMAALIGTLFGLGVLAGNSELTVMRASGVPVARIVGSVLKAGAVLMLAAMLVGEAIVPYTEQLAEHRRSVAISDRLTLDTRSGFWVRDGQSFVNIRSVLPGDRMHEVFIYEFDDSYRLRVATRARRAYYEGGKWILEDLRQSVIERDGVERLEAGRAVWASLFEPDLVNVVAVKPETLSVLGLGRYLRYLRENDLSTARFELAFWSKFAYPLATGVMIFLAVPLVLGHLRAVGIGQRVLVGALIGILFHVVNQISGHMGLVYDLSPALSAMLPTVLFGAAGAWLIRRAG